MSNNKHASKKYIKGNFLPNKKGFGFVKTDDDQDDLFIGRFNTNLAMQNDEVLASIIKSSKNNKAPEGRIEKIISRANKQIVGTFHAGINQMILPKTINADKFIGYITFDDEKFQNYLYLISKRGLLPRDGDVITAYTVRYPRPNTKKLLIGYINKIIGRKDAPGVDILKIVYSLKIPNVYPTQAKKEAKLIPKNINLKKSLKEGRRDLRQQNLITIDGSDTKDIDDAVVAWKKDNGNYHLGVHIADVSHYVPEKSYLDKEAYNRGTSVYLINKVIPMLPPEISNGIASLNPNEDRLAMSCEMEINKEGKIVKHNIFPSIIRSHARMTYDSVNKIIKGDLKERTKYKQISSMIDLMTKLHKILAKMRKKRGAIEFDTDEAEIIVDDEGHPTNVVLKNRGTGERMIESFMLAANETVAYHFNSLHVPFLYRVHETPIGDKVKKFFEFMDAIGYPISANPNNLKPRDFQKALKEVKGSPKELMIKTMMLRTTNQAYYSSNPIGHFGIAAKYYTHFTSPIRRYPDLVVHRLIKKYARFGINSKLTAEIRKKLPQIGIDTSEKERREVDAERATNDMKFAEYMENHIGETFKGVVNSALKFGLFVSLENTIEGLVHISTMNDDVYQYDETRQALIGRTYHHIYSIGQTVLVKVINANKKTRNIDFELADTKNIPFTKIRLPQKIEKRNEKRKKKSKNKHVKKGGYKSTGRYKLRRRR